MSRRITVLGGGGFGLAAAAHLALEGHQVTSRLVALFVEGGQLLLVNRSLTGVALRLASILEATRTTVRPLIGGHARHRDTKRPRETAATLGGSQRWWMWVERF